MDHALRARSVYSYGLNPSKQLDVSEFWKIATQATDWVGMFGYPRCKLLTFKMPMLQARYLLKHFITPSLEYESRQPCGRERNKDNSCKTVLFLF